MAAEQITVLIPCKDEEANIQACVDSARLIANEIIVADSGSTDDTLKIVHQLDGIRIIRHTWQGYGAFKNWAVNFVSNPWVLLLDADERVTPELASEIRQKLADHRSEIDAYSVKFDTYFLGHRLRFSNWNNRTIRLIKRDICHFSDRSVHEAIAIEPKRTGRLNRRLLHYSIRSYDQYFQKYMMYSKLAAEDLRDRGRRATPFSLLVRPFLQFAQLYLLRGGFLDGLAGIQVCMLRTFFYSFGKRARLWEMENSRPEVGLPAQRDYNAVPEVPNRAANVGRHSNAPATLPLRYDNAEQRTTRVRRSSAA